MPNKPVPAAAEGMPVVTPSELDRSYDLIALLDIVAFATSQLDAAGESIRGRLTGNIAVCVDLARGLANELNDVLTRMEARQK